MAGDRRAWLERLAIVGAAARGFVFVVVGSSAIHAGFRARRSSQDLATAFEVIIAAPLGRLLLPVIGLGLMAFAGWCVLDAILDTSRKGSEAKGVAQRAAGIFVGVVYCGLSVLALALTFELTRPGGRGIREWTGLVLSQPFGHWLVAIAGAIITAVGVFQLVGGFWRGRRVTQHRPGRALEGYGLASRGLLFLVIGGFMIVAALSRTATQVRGVRGAFLFLGQQPFGLTLVCVLGVGVAVHGIMSAIEAYKTHRHSAELRANRSSRINPPDSLYRPRPRRSAAGRRSTATSARRHRPSACG